MKCKRIAIISLAICLPLLMGACVLKPAAPWPEALKPGDSAIQGNGNVIEKKIQLPEVEDGYLLRITGISLRGSTGGAELIIDESLAREVVITADDNIAERMDVKHDTDGNIIIERQGLNFTPTKLTITVGAPVRALDINGAWRFTYNCPSVKETKIVVEGACSGDMTFGTMNRLGVVINGASELKLKGAAELADLTLNGAANVKAFELAAETADVIINGAGGCEITAAKTLNAEINGVGEIIYDGQPQVNRQIRGLGTVKARS